MEIFQDLNNKGITIVMVTHEPDIAQFALNGITFKDGRIVTRTKVATRKMATEELKKFPALSSQSEFV
jgi:putative ABC transport system ATP-binding protein